MWRRDSWSSVSVRIYFWRLPATEGDFHFRMYDEKRIISEVGRICSRHLALRRWVLILITIFVGLIARRRQIMIFGTKTLKLWYTPRLVFSVRGFWKACCCCSVNTFAVITSEKYHAPREWFDWTCIWCISIPANFSSVSFTILRKRKSATLRYELLNLAKIRYSIRPKSQGREENYLLFVAKGFH